MQSNLPSNRRRPLVAHTFDFVSAARGLVTLNRAVAVVGIKDAAGLAVAAVPFLVSNELEIDLMAGRGSELAIAMKSVLKQWRKMGIEAVAQLWGCAVAAPAGVPATFTFTVTGTATAAGDVVFRLAGRTLRASVNLGDAQNTTAASLKAAVDASLADLPGTAGVATNVMTFTYKTNGANGNDVKHSVVSTPTGVTVVSAAGVVGTGVASLVTALDALGSRDYDSVIICNHAAQDITDLGSHMDAMWSMTRQRWRWAFLASAGTIGTATPLATSANRPQIVIGSYENCPNLPGEIAAALGAVPVAFERPSQNYDGVELWLYAPPDADVYLDTEVETALAGGVTPFTVLDNGSTKLERLVTTKVTEAGAPFENLLDLSNSRTMAYTARQVDARVRRRMKGASANEDLSEDLVEIIYNTLKDIERQGDLHHVDDHAAEIRVEFHPSIPTRVLIDIPESVVPNAHQADATHRMLVEAA